MSDKEFTCQNCGGTGFVYSEIIFPRSSNPGPRESCPYCEGGKQTADQRGLYLRHMKQLG